MNNTLKKFIRNPGLIFKSLGHREFLNWIPDSLYLKISYYISTSKRLRLKDPKTFNEKLQWLKLYYRKPIMTKCVDKYEVRAFIMEKIGAEYLIPLVGGPWKRFDEIDFDKLPEQFVLKCTHDSGGLVICRDKSKLDIQKTRQKIEKCLRHNYFWGGREWPYKDIKPHIIAEKYMEDHAETSDSSGLVDYKFYCFNGQPQFLYISKGLENHASAHISFLTLEWEFAPFRRDDYAPFETLPKRPDNFTEMLQLCKVLASDFPFVRVDLYEIDGKVYFSELTFSPCSGFMPFNEEKYDLEIGQMIDLPSRNQSKQNE